MTAPNGNGWKAYAISGLAVLVIALGSFVMNHSSSRIDLLEARLLDIAQSRDQRTVELANINRRLDKLEQK